MRRRVGRFPREKCLSRWRDGWTDRAIADDLNEVPQLITRWRLRNKLPVHRNHNPARPKSFPRKYKYDLDLARELIVKQKRTCVEVANRLQVSVDTVYKLRVQFGVAKPHPAANLPPLEQRLAKAKEMLDEGMSYAEVVRTLHISRKTLVREHPGYTWTQQQATQHALDVRYAEQRINKVWSTAGRTQSLTNPTAWNGGA